jgi:hypothetical protein
MKDKQKNDHCKVVNRSTLTKSIPDGIFLSYKKHQDIFGSIHDNREVWEDDDDN